MTTVKVLSTPKVVELALPAWLDDDSLLTQVVLDLVGERRWAYADMRTEDEFRAWCTEMEECRRNARRVLESAVTVWSKGSKSGVQFLDEMRLS